MQRVDPISIATSVATPAATSISAPAAAATTPPPFTVTSVFTEAQLDSWVTVGLVLVAGLYLYGMHRLRVSGTRWPVARAALFLGPGLGGIASVTVSGLQAYDSTLLSVDMVQHLMLSMVAPIFLALGAPITLALQALPPGPRERLLAMVHSRLARACSHPLVAFAIFVVTPFAIYFTDLYRYTLEHAWAHGLVHAHVILAGCVFFWPLLGVDPLPGRWPHPGRALLMLLSVPLYTVLGLSIMQSSTLFAGDWHPSLGLTWADPWEDQVIAGGILWGGGEFVSVTVLAVLVGQWMRQAEREARRIDRELDRQEAHQRATEATG